MKSKLKIKITAVSNNILPVGQKDPVLLAYLCQLLERGRRKKKGEEEIGDNSVLCDLETSQLVEI